MKEFFIIQIRNPYKYFGPGLKTIIRSNIAKKKEGDLKDVCLFDFNESGFPNQEIEMDLKTSEASILLLLPDKPATFEAPWRELISTALCNPEKGIEHIYMFLHCRDIISNKSETHSKLSSEEKEILNELSREVSRIYERNGKSVNIQIMVFTHENAYCPIYNKLVKELKAYRSNHQDLSKLKKALAELSDKYRTGFRKKLRKELLRETLGVETTKSLSVDTNHIKEYFEI